MVTIIIPNYNYESFIASAIDSVLNQSYKDWECIIIDNGSTDDSIKQIKNRIVNDSRFKLIELMENLGVSAARNIGLKNAKHNFIQFLDADDTIHPNKLNDQLQVLNKDISITLVFGPYETMDAINKSRSDLIQTFREDNWLKGQRLLNFLLRGNRIVISAPLFRKNQSLYFDEAIAYNEDWLFWINLAVGQTVFFYLQADYATTSILKHDSNSSSNLLKMNVWQLNILSFLIVDSRKKVNFSATYFFIRTQLIQLINSILDRKFYSYLSAMVSFVTRHTIFVLLLEVTLVISFIYLVCLLSSK
ncbi:MAG: putative glycosyltransferase EpsJ [Bacteroidota bacterium]|jgi:glycosyltransferase involved in cell wall biosynthesis